MKTAIVIGHHLKSKGAMSPYFGLREFDFYNEVVGNFTGAHDIKVFKHDHRISGYTGRIKDTAHRINVGKFDLVIELHFNSFVNTTANGCETLYYFANQTAKNYAKAFSAIVASKTGIKVRGNAGAKALNNKQDRGFASVFYPAPTTILIEPFFGSSISDCKKIENSCMVTEIIEEFLDSIF